MMIDKQKSKEENRVLSDIQRMHQIMIEMGYFTQEELLSITKNNGACEKDCDSETDYSVSHYQTVQVARPYRTETESL